MRWRSEHEWSFSENSEEVRSGIALWPVYGLTTWGLTAGRAKRFFFSSKRPTRPWGTPCHWVPGSFSSSVYRPEREADHSPCIMLRLGMNSDVPLHSHCTVWRAQGQLSLSPSTFTLGRSWSSPVSVTFVITPEIRTKIALPLQQPAPLH